MRTWTKQGRLVTRRMYEQRIDEVFGTRQGGRVMQHARRAGLVSTLRQGTSYDRPLLPMERASLILISALCAGTSLTLIEASDLVRAKPSFRHAMLAAAATGEDLILRHAYSSSLSVMLIIPNATIRDPLLGVTCGRVVPQEAAAA
jgi:hypothetical protein